jgi:Bacterial membrane protein YfhO
VRYVVRRNRPRLLPSYGGTSFHPDRPLLSRDAGAAAGGDAFLPDGGPTMTSEVRLISAFSDGESVEDGTSVARIRLETTNGSERVLAIEAGRDVSDAARDVPGNPGHPGQVRAEVAFQYPRDNPESRRFGEQLYFGRLPINPPIEVRRVLIEIIDPRVGLEVNGLGLYNADTGEVTQARDKAKYQEVYRDKDITIMRNADAMPRAFLVGSAVAPPPGSDALALMQGGRIDLRRTAVLEEPIPPNLPIPPSLEVSPFTGKADIQSYDSERVVIRTESEQPSLLLLADAYFPGWKAQIDGEPAPILRADYLFRSVVLTPGDHTVSFIYQPVSVALGLFITLSTTTLVFAMAAQHAFAARRRRARISVRRVTNGVAHPNLI